MSAGQDAAAGALDRLKAMYARPYRVPFPPDNPYTPAKAELGGRLFAEAGLSVNRTLSCAGCHSSVFGFEDGQKLGTGAMGDTLARHTPTLWNLAWGTTFFWDGRAASLEEQARMPIESTAEMNQNMEVVVSDLRADAGYRAAFAKAFPADPEITGEKVLAAIATFERTLVPEPTRFDRWVMGEEDALTDREKQGFLLFNGKARCATCHTGFNFTDQAFHDIGLPDASDPGRGAVIGVPEANHAFKTPTLIDIGDRAPYMHDGSLPDLEAVIDHYVDGIVERPTLSADMKPVDLSDKERAHLIAFLHALDAEEPIGPDEIAARAGPPEERKQVPVVETDRIVQENLAFAPGRIRVKAGATVTVANLDTRTHTVDVNDPKFKFASGANKPGEDVAITFPEPGGYTVVCSIHPTMRLRVEAQ